MDKQLKLEKKRDQRHRRELTAKIDRIVSDYVRHKYPAVYAEAQEYYNELNGKYPTKKDLIKTVEHAVWKKKAREQRTANNKQMELKIRLLQNKKNKTTETIESTSNESIPPVAANEEIGLDESIPPVVANEETGLDESIPPVAANEETGLDESIPPVAANEEIGLDESIPPVVANEETGLDESIPPVGILTELDEITPCLNEEIPHHMVQEIIEELRADRELHELCLNMFPDDAEMLEEELHYTK